MKPANTYFKSINDCSENFNDFYRKIKTLSELFIHLIEIEILDERAIFLAEAMALCVQNYENAKIMQKKRTTHIKRE